jgi:hypothetical protein
MISCILAFHFTNIQFLVDLNQNSYNVNSVITSYFLISILCHRDVGVWCGIMASLGDGWLKFMLRPVKSVKQFSQHCTFSFYFSMWHLTSPLDERELINFVLFSAENKPVCT